MDCAVGEKPCWTVFKNMTENIVGNIVNFTTNISVINQRSIGEINMKFENTSVYTVSRSLRRIRG